MNYGHGRAALGKPASRTKSQASREAAHAGETLKKMTSQSQAVRAYAEQTVQDAVLMEPLIRMIVAARRERRFT